MRPGTRRTGKMRAVRMPIIDRFEGTLYQTLPYAWAIPAAQASLIAPLRMHGVFVEQLTERAVLTARRFALDSVVRIPAQGRQEMRVAGRWADADTVALDAGTFIVRAGQPLGILSLMLLEPQSDDGFTTWNYLEPWLQAGGSYPILRVTERIAAPLRGIRDN
jgi:hypothetical protein